MNESATLAQGNQVTNLILQKKTSKQGIQALLASKLLSKLLDAAKAGTIGNVNTFEFCRLLGLEEQNLAFYGESVKAKVSYHPDYQLWANLEILACTNKVHVESLEKTTFKDTLGQSDPVLCLAQVNRGSVSDAKETLTERDFKGANRRDLVGFFEANYQTLRDDLFSGRIILLGTVSSEAGETEKYLLYPFVELEKGKIKGSGAIRGDDLIRNGENTRFASGKDYFLISPINK